MNNKRVCIFVDGENLRHSIGDLFSNFDKALYLPTTNWTNFFNWVADEAVGRGSERVRTYWYVVQNIDFTPFNINSARRDTDALKKILSRDDKIAKTLLETYDPKEQLAYIEKVVESLLRSQNLMQRRFSGWTNIQDSIAHRETAVEFRRAGSIRFDLFKERLGFEKAVDVKLATDLIKLKDIYDVAVIVSGDQDYVPAVDTIKDYGKHTVNVAFLTQNNRLLPGGARRLNQSTDRSLEIKFLDAKNYLNL